MITATGSFVPRVCLVLIAALILPACATGFGKGPTERAKEITKLRRAGKRDMERYLDSELADLEALERAVQLLAKSTEVGSSSLCPSCFLEHATYVSMLGHHYRYLHSDLMEEAEQAESHRESAELEEEASTYRERMIKHFRDSNRSYRTYFRTSRAVDPVFYLRVATHYQFMKEWNAALRLLEVFEEESRNLLSARQRKQLQIRKRELRDKSQREIERPRQHERRRERRRETERRMPRERLE